MFNMLTLGFQIERLEDDIFDNMYFRCFARRLLHSFVQRR